MKKAVLLLLSVFLLITLATPAFAAESANTSKEEVAYGILAHDGNVESVYVVNIFNTGDIVDYGRYAEVENLTDSSTVTKNGDKITIASPSDRLYYQGTLEDVKLPWNIAIKYAMDGKEVSASDLSGATGALAIHIQITQNPDANKTFFENYALQISMSLNTRLCENIISDGASVASAGIDKQLSYIALPGKGAEIHVSADVRNFEMDAITFNGIRLNLDIDIDDESFGDQFVELTAAIAELDDGAGDLLSGVKELSNGTTLYLDGLSAYKEGLKAMSEGSEQLVSGISGLDEGLKSLISQNDSLVAGALGIQQNAFDSVNKQLSGMGIPEITPENYLDILSGNTSLSAVKSQLDNVVSFTNGVIAYTSGASQLEAGASEIKVGVSELSLSLSRAALGAQDLYDGASQLNYAVRSLQRGLAEYRSGVAELRDGTDGIENEISDKIDELLQELSGSDEVISFVSEKNTDVTSVQFVLKTGAIDYSPDGTVPTTDREPLTFWDRLLALFGF